MVYRKDKNKAPGLLLGLMDGGSLERRILRLMDRRAPWARHRKVMAAAVCVATLSAASAGVGMFGVRASQAQSGNETTQTATFDTISIRPIADGEYGWSGGFIGSPGGRVYYGGDVRMLIAVAFGLESYQLSGGPKWAGADRQVARMFQINATPPEDSASRKVNMRIANPTAEQRLMLQSLLRDRFSLKYHFEPKEGEVYILTKGSGAPRLTAPKDPNSDPRAIVFGPKGNDFVVRGMNTTTDILATRMSTYLKRPVLNQTGVKGSYDFEFSVPDSSETHDMGAFVLDVADQLGFKVKRGRGPIQTLVIDHVDLPTEN